MLGSGATASRRIRYQPFAIFSVVAVSFGVCYWMVPDAGMLGAAMATVAASGVGVLSILLLLISKPDKVAPNRET